MNMDINRICEVFSIPQRPAGQVDGFRSVGTSRIQKVYRDRASTRHRGTLSIPGMTTRDDPTAFENIGSRVDGRPSSEVKDEAESALKQLLCRAKLGDAKAVELFAEVAYNATASLEKLGETNPELVTPNAAKRARWPCLLSLNPRDVRWNIAHLETLKAGQKTVTPPHRKQRSDPHDFWAHLAGQGLQACWEHRQDAAILRDECAEAIVEPVSGKLWGTLVTATLCRHSDGKTHLVPDWQRRCWALQWPVSAENHAEVWAAVQLCILHYWTFQNPGSYQEALRRIGRDDEKEAVRRNAAFKRLEQVFGTIVGIR